uniref:Uncharacterized protein n=1 Tax=Solanum lycopersicum TaxID=4081 RepID=A0A3Q7IVY7_SOLLC
MITATSEGYDQGNNMCRDQATINAATRILDQQQTSQGLSISTAAHVRFGLKKQTSERTFRHKFFSASGIEDIRETMEEIAMWAIKHLQTMQNFRKLDWKNAPVNQHRWQSLLLPMEPTPPLPISPTSAASLGLYSIWPLPVLTSSLLSTELLSACINQVNMLPLSKMHTQVHFWHSWSWFTHLTRGHGASGFLRFILGE